METLQQLIHEVARFVGRMGCTVSFGFNPEHCPHCDVDSPYGPLNDPIIDETGGNGDGPPRVS